MPTPVVEHERRRARRRLLLWALLFWAVAAYLVAPWVWKRISPTPTPLFMGVPPVTETGDGRPGDPLNIAIVGTEAQLIRAITSVGWFPSDPITFDTSVRIVVDSVFRKPDDQAPVSSLYLFGRKQDLAFEQPVGNSPRQRHHVRFWRWAQQEDGQPVWFGSATFDERVGLSYTTGQVTHHIGPDVDAERDRIDTELQAAGWVAQLRWIDGFHQQLQGRNGGGDLWKTDGRLAVIRLSDPGPQAGKAKP